MYRVNKLDTQRKQLTVVRNRQPVSTLIRAVLYCVRQSTALEGHRETKHSTDDDSTNRGNFAELCQLLAKENPAVARKLKAMSASATYMSRKAQDDFLQATATVVRRQITEEIADPTMYAISK